MEKVRNYLKTKSTTDIFLFMLVPLMLAVTVYSFSAGISGNDFWWHIKVGEWIVNNKSIPHDAIFSWCNSEQNMPWTAHEWLSEVVFWIIYSKSGELGIFVFCLCIAIIIEMALYTKSKEYCKKNPLVGGLMFVLLAVVVTVVCYGRPQIFSFCFLLCEFICLYDFYENPESKKIYALPVLALLWANFHGGSSNMVYIISIVFLFAGVCKFQWGCIVAERMEKNAWMKLLVITLVSAMVICINPYGLKMLLYPYENMGDNLMLSVISEWGSPDAKDTGSLILYFIPIAIILLGLIAEKVKIRWVDVLVFAMFILLFLRSERFIIFWYIAIPFCALRYVIPCRIKETEKMYDKILLYAIAVVTIIPIIISISRIAALYNKNQLISKDMDKEMIELIKEENPQRLYNDYNLGEMLIYNDIPVFIDGRADIYSSCGILTDAVSLISLICIDDDTEDFNINDIIDKYNFDAFLTLKSRALYTYLIEKPDKYELVGQDSTCAYFVVK